MRKEPEIVTVTLKKHNGMGLSIVAAKVRDNFSYSFWGVYNIDPQVRFLQGSFSFGRDLNPIVR